MLTFTYSYGTENIATFTGMQIDSEANIILHVVILSHFKRALHRQPPSQTRRSIPSMVGSRGLVANAMPASSGLRLIVHLKKLHITPIIKSYFAYHYCQGPIFFSILICQEKVK